MKKDFDFDKIGKKMPYRTPEGFFDQMEANIRREVGLSADAAPAGAQDPASTGSTPKTRRRTLPWLISASIVVAAGLAVMFILKSPYGDANSSDFSQIEEAFANLSPQDQTYMLEVYEYDVFINE